MKEIVRALHEEDELKSILSGLDMGKSPAVVSGLSPVHRAHLMALIMESTGLPVCAVCSDDSEARRFAGDIAGFTGKTPVLITERDFVFYNVEGVSRQGEHSRITALYKLLNGENPVVATVEGICQRTMPPEVMKKVSLEIDMSSCCPPEKLTYVLTKGGYSRCEQVEGPGQFALRGGILDFFSPAHEFPVRIEYWGDDIDSMSYFDPSTQRRTEVIERAIVLPACEILPDMYSGAFGSGADGLAGRIGELYARLSKKKNKNEKLLENLKADIDRLQNGRGLPSADKYGEFIYDTMASAADYLPPEAAVFMCEPARCGDRFKNYDMQMSEDTASLLEAGAMEASLVRFYYTWDEICEKFAEHIFVMSDNFTGSNYPVRPRALGNLRTKQLPSYGGSIETAKGDIAYYMSSGYRVVVLCGDERRGEILRNYLRENGVAAAIDVNLRKLPAAGECLISVGSLSAGFEYPGIKLAVITEGQIVKASQSKRKKAAKSSRQRIASFTDLAPGDLVVHEQYGIGRFVGIFKMPVDGVEKDYIKISYAGTDSLYVPATSLDLVSKYIGGGEDAPVKLSKMGGADWVKAKSRAKGAAKEMAKELIALYAQRQKVKGFAFSPDTVWQDEFEASFGYQETEDQLRCISEIKEDMEKPVPMDRLLCGDVGYGKTEVALRAVMKCIMSGKQAAILVPTTVLAQQHYVTILKRFADFPVKADILSRFRTPAQIKKTVRDMESGAVDIVVGTHRLLQKDIKFKDLGLLIVDEEQRFGVSHKEALKELTKSVDVLTLSATPIPRTLNMALSGIRDMSTIEEPPKNRQPVQTYVLEHDWGILCDAMRRELGRGGQVYYIHNRIENIQSVAARISQMMEGAAVAVAHGRMDQEHLSEVMERLSDGDIQILVCTTIIETGIDIPNVNTLIIEDADKMGLAQLHQIRGRVGRSPRRAFAYLTFRKGKVLSEVAEKRLSAIREFAEFNSGFKIAMRDLEIRGAGNLLGAEQSGHMMSVGYDMYLKLLEEAVLEEKGEKTEHRTECSADLTVSANIPEKYVSSPEQRMDLYRRIALVRSEEEADEMVSELIDRFGDPPREVIALVNIALLRAEAAKAHIPDISQKAGWLRFKLEDFDMERISGLYALSKYKGRLKIEAGTSPVVALKVNSGRVIDDAMNFVRDYSAWGKK